MKKLIKRLAATKYKEHILAVYISGNNIETALMGVNGRRSFKILFKSERNIKNLNNILDFIISTNTMAKEHYGAKVKTCVIGAAGPISGNRKRIKMTNINIEIDKDMILSKTDFSKVLLLNNFEAIGYGIDFLNLENDVIKLPHVDEDMTWARVDSDTVAVVGFKTGLGMTIALYDKGKMMHRPMPSEGGHMDLVIYDKSEMDLLNFLKKKMSRKNGVNPEFERILSDKGLENIFDFYSRQNSGKIVKDIKKLGFNEKIIQIEANYHLDKTCKKTIDKFTSFYARLCKNLALVSECYSGIFITDRIVWNNIKRLDDKKNILMAFMKEFEKHDKESEVLSRIPVYLVKRDDIKFHGCCNAAVNFFD